MRLERRNISWAVAAGCVLALAGGAKASGEFGPMPGYCQNPTSVSFIDSALPLNQLRVKWDSAYNLSRPNRAEFFWPAQGANGRPVPERSVDYHELRSYFEVACHDRLSFFVEMPVRFVEPEINDSTSGAGDLNAGMKLVVCETELAVVSGQFRAYAPTGVAERGLGRDRVTLEPGLLINQRLHDWITLESEVKYWLPLQGSVLAGDVMRYGVGMVFGKQSKSGCWITPTAEFVGWVPLSGREQFITEANTLVEQAVRGRNVLTGLFGGRVGMGDHCDLYGGYGMRLGGDAGYDETWRVEFRLKF